MPFNGSGSFSLIFNWQQDALNNINISSSRMMGQENDIAAGLSLCLTKDGQQIPTANLPMGGFRHTNVGNAQIAGNYASAVDVQNASLISILSVSGTDTITGNTTPTFGAYANTIILQFVAAGTNATLTPTLNVNSVGAKNLIAEDGSALLIGSIQNGRLYRVWYDGTSFRVLGLSASTIPSGSPITFRNRFIDGNFDFWDFGTSITPSSGIDTYTADMWIANTGSGGACTISRQNFALGSEPSIATSPCRNYLQWQQTGSATTNPVLGQRLESVFTDDGRSCTVSCILWVNSGTLTIPSVKAVQSFGSGGSPSGSTTTTVTTNWNVTTTPTRFSVRIDVPSISGKTLGINGNDSLFVGFNLPTGQTFTLNFAQAQDEPCPSGAPAVGLPTIFEFRGYPIERQMINRHLRYYGQGVTSQTLGVVVIASNTQFQSNWVFDQPMRGVPALTWGNLSYGISGVAVVTGLSINVGSAQSLSLNGTSGATAFSAGQVANLVTTNGSGFVAFDARL